MSSEPLVSIGLPTYNRAEKLERAMEFVLAQDYRNIEVVISDNASTDNTAAVCERLCRSDNRIRYIRQKTNIGPTANYMAVLEASSGDMYMALADDDWIAPNYVSACLTALLDNSELVLVCGQSIMYRNGEFSHDAPVTTLFDDSAADRVVRYYRTVVENGAFHGIIRRDVLLRLPRMKRVMAGDWLWMAAIAFQGKLATSQSTKIMKHLGGSTASWEAIVATLSLPLWQAKYWMEAIFTSVGRDIWRSPVYAPLGYSGRLLLLSRVALVLGRRWRIWNRWRTYVGKTDA
jgi:glycosyltransferase involved in cell wall biosynthesis